MAKDIDYSKIGLRISSLRKKAGLTQEVLAARCGCTSNHLSNVEVGKCKPSLDLVIRLAVELDSSVDFFLLGTPHVSCQYLLHSQIGPKTTVMKAIEVLRTQMRQQDEFFAIPIDDGYQNADISY